jgi:phosphatidylglycerol:prolipoprotein diacylglycerol transferase
VIPYFEVPTLHLGPVPIQPFGILTALGVYTAATLLARDARKRGLDPQPVSDFAVWGVLAGVVVAHFVHLFLYHPEELRERGPLQILRVWDGLSSTGGALGGVLAAAVFFRLRRVRFSDYADTFALSVATGWAIARLGCFAVHDHLGIRSNSPLAVDFPGGARFDLGLFDAVLLFSISALLYYLARRGALTGRLLALLALLYGAGRFCLDFLRARDIAYADARYLGLTPAQYAALALIAYGLWQLTRKSNIGPWRAPSTS